MTDNDMNFAVSAIGAGVGRLTDRCRMNGDEIVVGLSHHNWTLLRAHVDMNMTRVDFGSNVTLIHGVRYVPFEERDLKLAAKVVELTETVQALRNENTLLREEADALRMSILALKAG